jgi:hypothetical protein
MPLKAEPVAGFWPAARSLLTAEPDTAWVTAFRTTHDGCEIVANDVSGETNMVSVAGAMPGSASLPPYGIATLRIRRIMDSESL